MGMSNVDEYRINLDHQVFIFGLMFTISTLFFFSSFSFTIRAWRTRTTWGLLEGKCHSPMSCRRSFILKPRPRTTVSTCWAPSKASASTQWHSQAGNTARRPLQHQRGGTLVKSCDHRHDQHTHTLIVWSCLKKKKQQERYDHIWLLLTHKLSNHLGNHGYSIKSKNRNMIPVSVLLLRVNITAALMQMFVDDCRCSWLSCFNYFS